MARKAHDLHMSLKDSGHEPKHHKYMIENRRCTHDDVRFYRHVHPVQDLLAFIDDVHINDNSKDKTIGKTFTLKFLQDAGNILSTIKLLGQKRDGILKYLVIRTQVINP